LVYVVCIVGTLRIADVIGTTPERTMLVLALCGAVCGVGFGVWFRRHETRLERPDRPTDQGAGNPA
jgi:uncharacterized membrane protein YsdA (DUF1294 family)